LVSICLLTPLWGRRHEMLPTMTCITLSSPLAPL